MSEIAGGLDFHLMWTLGLTLAALAGLGVVNWREKAVRRARRQQPPERRD